MDDPRFRLDKWLWAARFFKTRALAAEAIAGGKIELNGARPKRGHVVKLDDEIRVKLGPYLHVVHVRGLSAHRGPATVAQQLYEETAESREARERHAERLKAAPPPLFTEGRPTKKDRRNIRRLKEGW